MPISGSTRMNHLQIFSAQPIVRISSPTHHDAMNLRHAKYCIFSPPPQRSQDDGPLAAPRQGTGGPPCKPFGPVPRRPFSVTKKMRFWLAFMMSLRYSDASRAPEAIRRPRPLNATGPWFGKSWLRAGTIPSAVTASFMYASDGAYSPCSLIKREKVRYCNTAACVATLLKVVLVNTNSINPDQGSGLEGAKSSLGVCRHVEPVPVT